MAQRVKVQDGVVVYSTDDPSTTDINFAVKGKMDVTKVLHVGNDIEAAGSITTPDGSGADLIISTNTNGILNGNIRFEPVTGGNILLNNVVWPDGTVQPNPGMYLGVSALNTLQFLNLPPSGEIIAPLNEIVFGTGTSVTTDSNLTYDGTTETLHVSGAGTGLIQSGLGESLEIEADVNLIFSTNAVERLKIASTGSWEVNGSTGTSGQTLTSAGPGTPPTWESVSRSMVINTQTSDYMLQLTDAYNTLIRITKATAAVVTIPNDSTTNMPIGSAVLIGWNGLGQVSIAGEVGVTVDTPETYNIKKQFGKVTAIKVGANHWEIEGNLLPI